MQNNDFEFLEFAIKTALKQLYAEDSYLIWNSPQGRRADFHVSERGIVFRFGIYFDHIIRASHLSLYHVDVEYNRNLRDMKRTRSFQNGTYPDLIVHKRGENDNNLLILEFKTWWNCENKDDIQKIKEFMQKDGPYHYRYGVSIILWKDEPEIVWVHG